MNVTGGAYMASVRALLRREVNTPIIAIPKTIQKIANVLPKIDLGALSP